MTDDTFPRQSLIVCALSKQAAPPDIDLHRATRAVKLNESINICFYFDFFLSNFSPCRLPSVASLMSSLFVDYSF